MKNSIEELIEKTAKGSLTTEQAVALFLEDDGITNPPSGELTGQRPQAELSPAGGGGAPTSPATSSDPEARLRELDNELGGKGTTEEEDETEEVKINHGALIDTVVEGIFKTVAVDDEFEPSLFATEGFPQDVDLVKALPAVYPDFFQELEEEDKETFLKRIGPEEAAGEDEKKEGNKEEGEEGSEKKPEEKKEPAPSEE